MNVYTFILPEPVPFYLNWSNSIKHMQLKNGKLKLDVLAENFLYAQQIVEGAFGINLTGDLDE